MFTQKPTFSRILFLNGFFHVLAIGIPIAVIYRFLLGNLAEDNLTAFTWYPAIILLVGSVALLAVSLKHYRRVISIMEDGYQTQGKIVERFPRRGGGYVVYEYKHHGQVCRSSERLLLGPVSKNIKIGQEVTVLVSRQSPSQSLLYDLYQ